MIHPEAIDKALRIMNPHGRVETGKERKNRRRK